MHVINNVYSEYVWGGINTTGVTYDKLKIVFRADGTATYTDQFGNSYPAIWKFNTSDEREILYTVNFPEHLENGRNCR